MGDGDVRVWRGKPDTGRSGRVRADCGDGLDRLAQDILVFVIVMPRHGGRAMADDALHNRERHPCVGRERNEGMPQRMERCDDDLATASIHPDRHRNVGRLEDAPQPIVELPLAIQIQICHLRVYEGQGWG